MKSRPLFFIKIFVFVCIIIVLSVYFSIQAKPFLSGPKIVLDTPFSGQVFEEPFIEIKGRVFNPNTLLLNDKTVLTDSSGYFEDGLILAKGYNIIELSAEDRFGKTTKKKLEVILK